MNSDCIWACRKGHLVRQLDTDKTLHDIADTFDVGFEWLKFGDERYRKSPVNRKLIDWLVDHQEIGDQLWKKMLDEEQN